MKNISNFAFCGLRNLTEVSMTGCQLSEAPSIAPIVNTLRVLNLGSNNLTRFPENYFDECKLLHTIEFDRNLLTAIPDVRGLSGTMRMISLASNRITSIGPLCFLPMTKLKSVNLSKNLIMEIVFENVIWPSLKVIDLSENCLTSINIDGLNNVLRTAKIELVGNPWHCNVKFCWLSHCKFRAGIRPGWGVWSNCRGTELIRLMGDINCNSPVTRKYQTINETGKVFLQKECKMYATWYGKCHQPPWWQLM